jgi:predicted solute-binding protein
MTAVNRMGWNEILMYIIETVLKLVVAVAIPYGFNILRKKLQNDTQIKYLGKFEQLVADAVNQVQQTYVANLKAQDMFDREAQMEALAKVKTTVINMMNDRMQEIVIDAVGDFDTYMRNLIESEV